MNRLKRGYAKFTEIINQVSDHHVGAYAAQTAYLLYAVYDSYHTSFVNVGSLYTDYEGRCDERCDPCIPVFCGIYDHNDC